MGWSSLFGQIDSSRKKFRGKKLLWDQSSGVKSLICLPFGALKEANSRTGLPGLIAEVKKASPSRGVLREDFDPVKQLHDWLSDWNKKFLNTDQKEKGKKQNDFGAKKAVLLSGNPGIGKTTSAKLVSQMLCFQTIEVNASDSRGKADAKIEKGIGGSTSNSIKELVSNEALSLNMECSQRPKTVLIMDEVDGMSAGDRGGVADLITSIKISKIPIIMCDEYRARVYVCRKQWSRNPKFGRVFLLENPQGDEGVVGQELSGLIIFPFL